MMKSQHRFPQPLDLPGVHLEAKRPQVPISALDIQYWLLPGYNSWVGDVVTFWHNDRYHLFYLYDRRHHQSKFGKGAHYFEHLSTTDFRTWVEHAAAIPIDEQWECIGTGTPFLFNNKFYLSYGLHTGPGLPRRKDDLASAVGVSEEERTHRLIQPR